MHDDDGRRSTPGSGEVTHTPPTLHPTVTVLVHPPATPVQSSLVHESPSLHE